MTRTIRLGHASRDVWDVHDLWDCVWSHRFFCWPVELGLKVRGLSVKMDEEE
jgi:hypothetical protein